MNYNQSISDNMPGNAMATTCTNLHPIGMTSSSNPAGIITNFKYEGFEIFQRVENHKGSIDRQYEYRY